MRRQLSSATLLLLWLWLAALPGCGSGYPGFVPVEGTVTIDGEPVERLAVEFTHENGTQCYGRTDSSGYYELYYTDAQNGALVGKHTVRIRPWLDQYEMLGIRLPDAPPPLPWSGSMERRYVARSEMTADVGPNGGTFDFALVTEAPAADN